MSEVARELHRTADLVFEAWEHARRADAHVAGAAETLARQAAGPDQDSAHPLRQAQAALDQAPIHDAVRHLVAICTALNEYLLMVAPSMVLWRSAQLRFRTTKPVPEVPEERFPALENLDELTGRDHSATFVLENLRHQQLQQSIGQVWIPPVRAEPHGDMIAVAGVLFACVLHALIDQVRRGLR